MNEEHIILRVSRPFTRDIFRGGASPSVLEAAPTEVKVEIDQLNSRTLSAANRSADVVAIAPVIPMKLIAPVDIQATAAPEAAAFTWGVEAVGALTSPFTGDGITVAVLDTGIDATHPAFAGVNIIQKDFTGEGDGDRHGHGTHCAGTIFGRSVNGTRIGVATGVKKALIGKVLGANSGSSASIINAIQWAAQNGANVISMSLGIDFPGYVKYLIGQNYPPELATSQALEAYRANVQLFEKMAGLILASSPFFQTTSLIAAAGNESRRGQTPSFEIAVSPPAVSDGFISVAALGLASAKYTVANFSNTGALVSGPGVDIISAKPGGGLATMSGTSMATPHVAGVAALWAEKLTKVGALTPANLTARIIASGTTGKMNTGFDPFDIGSGMVQAPQS